MVVSPLWCGPVGLSVENPTGKEKATAQILTLLSVFLE